MIVMVELPEMPQAGVVLVRLKKDVGGWYAILDTWDGKTYGVRGAATTNMLDGALGDLEAVVVTMLKTKPISEEARPRIRPSPEDQ